MFTPYLSCYAGVSLPWLSKRLTLEFTEQRTLRHDTDGLRNFGLGYVCTRSSLLRCQGIDGIQQFGFAG